MLVEKEFGLFLEGTPTREEIRRVIAISNSKVKNYKFECGECASYEREDFGDYSSDGVIHHCHKREANANLKSFPFKNAPTHCFCIASIWFLELSLLINEVTYIADRGWASAPARLFRRTDKWGRFPIGNRDPETLEKRKEVADV